MTAACHSLWHANGMRQGARAGALRAGAPTEARRYPAPTKPIRRRGLKPLDVFVGAVGTPASKGHLCRRGNRSARPCVVEGGCERLSEIVAYCAENAGDPLALGFDPGFAVVSG